MFVRFEFYVDASPKQGTGHVMRSSVLGLELAQKGHKICFYGELNQPDWVWEYLTLNAFCIHIPPVQIKHNDPPSIIFVDTYSSILFENLLELSNDIPLVTIEDAFTPAFNSRFKIIQTLEPAVLQEIEFSPYRRQLSGPDYLLLRKSLASLSRIKSGNSLTKNVLVMSGGSDSTGFLSALVKVLPHSNASYFFHVIGDMPDDFSDQSKLIKFYPFGTRPENLHVGFAVAICLAGVSSLEILSAGIPLVVSSGTDNQLPLYKSLTSMGYAIPLLPKDEIDGWLFTSKDLLLALNVAAEYDLEEVLFDYHGPSRILSNLESWFALEF